MGFSYPPTEDQLRIISPFYTLLSSDNLLWILRIFSLLLVIASLYLWWKLLNRLINKRIAFISVVIILISPTIFVLWMLHPFDCLKFFLISIFISLAMSIKKKWILFSIIGSCVLILLSSVFTSSERSSFLHKLSLSDAQSDVNIRFGAEDKLTDPVEILLSLKRVSYNKYFFYYKNLINEVIPFFDLETIFYQEIHPLESKSVVLFIWPEIFLFLFGIYFLYRNKYKKLSQFITLMFLISFWNYIFCPNEPYRKFVMILFPISILIALTINEGFKRSIGFMQKSMFIATFIVLMYGIGTNYYDLFNRTSYWLDNRPLFYDFVFKTISEKGVDNYSKIQVSSLVGKTEMYCNFYLKKCDTDKFVFKSFDLTKEKLEDKKLYAGFVGEFIGPDYKNNMNSNWKNMISGNEINIIKIDNLRDTIAYKYGNEIIVGEKR